MSLSTDDTPQRWLALGTVMLLIDALGTNSLTIKGPLKLVSLW